MEKIKASVCITVLNEEKTIESLLNSLLKQSVKPLEIIIVDGGSTDRTAEIVQRYDDFKLVISKGASRSKARNMAIKMAKSEIIALTDAGCIPDVNWLRNITKPFESGNIDVVAGFYKMVSKTKLQKSMEVFLGVSPKDLNSKFMPSARSMAFKKDIWKKAGGFPNELDQTAEDTLFNTRLLSVVAKFHVAQDAIVEWHMPNSIYEFFVKMLKYAKGDAKSGIWWHPVKKFKTHNLKILTVYLRYIIFAILVVANPYLFVGIFLMYLLYAYNKAGFWGIPLQIISDFAVIIGFANGLF